MIVQWVFRRGDDRALIDIVRTDSYYVVHVREPHGERWISVATAIDAILEQADVERALTWAGWYLADFHRSGRLPQAHSPLRCAVGSRDGVPPPAPTPSVITSAVDASPAFPG